VTDVKRICGNCGSDRTPKGEGIYEVRDCRGNTFSLVGSCCHRDVIAMVDKLAVKYGAYIENGVWLCSPIGSPTIRDIDHLRREISA